MKKINLILGLFTTLLCLSNSIFAQKIYSVNFENLPQDFQLYPRNDKNEAIVPINGTIELPNWKYMSVVVYRNKIKYLYQRSDFQYSTNGNIGTFNLKPIIKSELAEYDFKIYANYISQSGKDSVLMTERKNIVAGDAYLIYGQSNARAWEVDYKYRNEYARTFGFGSQTEGYTWGLSNSGFTGGQNGEQNIVGEWGIDFQKTIAENYGIPTCVINSSTSGADIKSLSDRNPNNPADFNTLYGRMLNYVQKAKLVDNIKGFFYWQAETDAAQNPNLWKPGFDKMYKFWEQDFPSIKKYYVFQIPLFGAGEYNDDVGVLRDYLRKLGDFYPKITTYAPVGAPGWNGWHFELEGYQQIGKEIGQIVGTDFYNKKKGLSSPNIRKAYYSTKNRDEITLAFEDGIQMIYPKDTIVTKIGGGEMNSSLKDFFYLNGVWQKVASGRAEANRIILKLKEKASENDSLIKYLPSVYPYSSGSFILQEAPWIYIGPFLKNTDGMRAFVFHHHKISKFPDFQAISLKNTINEHKNVSVKWNLIDGAKNYILERFLAKDSTNILILAKLSPNIISFSDTSASPNTNYIYRLKAVNDLTESPFSILKIRTTEDSNAPTLKSEIVYFNKAIISWTAPNSFKADYFILEKKLGENEEFKKIAQLKIPIQSFTDTNLVAGNNYYYRIKGYNSSLQTSYSQVEVSMPPLLTKPEINASIVYYNSLKIDWKEVINAKEYILERKILNEPYKIIQTFDSKTVTFIDKSVVENTNYSYRIKAFTDKTESVYAGIDIKTPSLLSKPDLSSTIISYNSVKLEWKNIIGATSINLERKFGSSNYIKIATFDNKTTEFIEKDLKENTLYSYRMKAFGDKTESLEITLEIQTPAILSTPELTLEAITYESVKLKWKSIPKATKYNLERQSQGETSFTKILETDNLLEFTDSKLKENTAYNYRLKATRNVSESGYGSISIKTVSILSILEEPNSFFNVFPNPSNEKVVISFQEPLTGNLSLINISGKTFLDQKISKQKSVELNVSTYPKGVYIVSIITNQKQISKKLIIE